MKAALLSCLLLASAIRRVLAVCDMATTLDIQPATTITATSSTWYIEANEPPRWVFPTFSDQGTEGCAITSYEIYTSSAGVLDTSVLEVDTATSGEVRVQLKANFHTEITQTFALKINVDGGQHVFAETSSSQTLFTLVVVCGLNSASIVFDDTAPSFATTQFGDASVSNPAFILPYIYSSLEKIDPTTTCKIDNTAFFISDTTGFTVATNFATPTVNIVSAVDIYSTRSLEPDDKTIHGSNTFVIRAQTSGTTTVQGFSPEYIFLLDEDCSYSTLGTETTFWDYDDTTNWWPSQMNQTIDLSGSPATNVAVVDFPAQFTLLNTYCEAARASWTYTFATQEDNDLISAVDGTKYTDTVTYLTLDTAAATLGTVRATDVDRVYAVNFTITVNFGTDTDGTDIEWTTNPIWFKVICTDADRTIIPDPSGQAIPSTFEFTQYVGTADRNKVEWTAYTCVQTACCSIPVLKWVTADQTDHSILSVFSNPPDNGAVYPAYSSAFDPYFLVDEATTGVYTAYVYTIDPIMNGDIAPLINTVVVTINHECTTDTYTLNTGSLVVGANLTTTGGGKAYVEKDPTNTFNQIRYWVDRDESTNQINVAAYFQNTLTTNCSISGYRVTSAKALIADASVPSFMLGQVLRITSDGQLRVDQESTAFVDTETYEVIIDAYNGHVYGSETQALLVIQFYSSDVSPAVPESPPYFVDPVPSNYTFNVTELGTTSEDIILPETFDPNIVDVLSLTIADLDEAQFTFDNSTRTLTVNFDQFNSTETVSLTAKIEDETGLYTEADFSVIVIKDSAEDLVVEGGDDGVDGGPTDGPEVEEEEEPWWSPVMFPDGYNFTVKEDMRIVELWVQSFSRYGELVLGFNDTAFAAIDPEMLNLTTMDIYIVPAAGREKEEGFKMEQVNFTWEAPEMMADDDEREATFTLVFLNPILISPLEQQDSIIVHFKERYYPLENEPIGFLVGNQTLKLKARKQVEPTALTKNFESGVQATEGALVSLLVISFLLQILLTGGMQYLVVFIRSLQLILHLPLLNVIVPANVLIMFSTTMSIAMFDVLDPAWTTELVLEFDDEAQEELAEDIPSQWQEMGYENYNSILNLGSLSVFLSYQFFKMLVWGGAKGFSLYDKKADVYVKIIGNGLFFGGILTLLVDAYFEFLISGYLVTMKPLFTMSGETLSVIVGYSGFFIAVFFLPISLFWVAINPIHHTKEDEFLERWGALYGDLKYHSKMTQSYYLAFAARRVIYVAVLFFAKAYPQLQIQALLVLHLFSGMYIGLVSAHQEKLIVYIELVNEFFIQAATLHMSVFYMLAIFDEPGKYTVGWYLCIWVTIFIIINLYFILKSAGWQIFLVAKRYWNMLRRSQKLKKYAQRTDQTLAKKLRKSLADFELTFKEMQETENVLGSSCYGESMETENEEYLSDKDINLALKPYKKQDPSLLKKYQKQQLQQSSSSSSRGSDQPILAKKKTKANIEGNPTWINPTQPGASNDSNDTFSFRDRSIIESSMRDRSNSRSPRSPRSPGKSPRHSDNLQRIPEGQAKIKKSRSGGSRKKSKPKKKMSKKKKSTLELDGPSGQNDEPIIRKSHPNSNPGSKKTLTSDDRSPSGTSSPKRKSKKQQAARAAKEEEKDPFEGLRLKKPPQPPGTSLYESNKAPNGMNPFPQRQIVDLSGYTAPDRNQGDVLAAGCEVEEDSNPPEWNSKQQTKGSGWRQVLANMEDNERKSNFQMPGQPKESGTSHQSLIPTPDYHSMFDTWNNKSKIGSDQSDESHVNTKPKGSVVQSKLNSGTSLNSVNPFRGLTREETKDGILPPVRGAKPGETVGRPKRQVEKRINDHSNEEENGGDASPDRDSSEERDMANIKIPSSGLTMPMESTHPSTRHPGVLGSNSTGQQPPSGQSGPSRAQMSSGVQNPQAPKQPYNSKPTLAQAKPGQGFRTQDSFNPFEDGANDDPSGLGVANVKEDGVIVSRSREGDGEGLLYSFKKKTPFTDFVTGNNRRFQKSISPRKDEPNEPTQERQPSFKKKRSKNKSGSPKAKKRAGSSKKKRAKSPERQPSPPSISPAHHIEEESIGKKVRKGKKKKKKVVRKASPK